MDKLAELLLAYGQLYQNSPTTDGAFRLIIALITDNLSQDKWVLFVKWFFKNYYDNSFSPSYNDWAGGMAAYLYGSADQAWANVCRMTVNAESYGEYLPVVLDAFGTEDRMRGATQEGLGFLKKDFVPVWQNYTRGKLK